MLLALIIIAIITIIGIFNYCVLSKDLVKGFKESKKSIILVSLICGFLIPKFVDLIESFNIQVLNFYLRAPLGNVSLETEYIALLYILVILLTIPAMNYLEELYFRKNWYLVIAWVFIHLFLGLGSYSIASLIGIGIMGIIFKVLYDRYNLGTAWLCHIFYNYSILLFSIVFLLFGY